MQFKGLLSPDLCRKIIDRFEHDGHKHPGYGLDAKGDLKISPNKVSTELSILPKGDWQTVHEEIHACVGGAIQAIVSKFPPLQVAPLGMSDYKIKRYTKKEGHFKWHFDALGPGAWHRQMALVLYLNDVKIGGETAFHFQNLTIEPRAGDALFFPPFWTNFHCGFTPESEDKYIITSFAQFMIPERTAA